MSVCSLVFDCVCVCVCACTNGFGKVKGHLMFVESTVCVLTLADGWCRVLAYVCGQWAQMEDNCQCHKHSGPVEDCLE